MPARGLDAATVLAATEEVLRRHGPAKATVVDVARALGVSHAAVYRHFPSKNALREAVTRQWLGCARDELAEIAADDHVPPAHRLGSWLHALHDSKYTAVKDDPELFSTFGALAAEHSSVAAEHVADLVGLLRDIVAAGVDNGDFAAVDPAETAAAIFDATCEFHHPAHAADWHRDDTHARLDRVVALLVTGLRGHPDRPGSPQ